MAYVGNTNITQGFIPAVDFFSGNASTVAFTLSRPVASVAQVEVYVSNVPQTPNTAFSVSGNTITFTSAPPSGTNNIYVYYTSPITQVIAPSQGTVTTSSLASSTGSGAVVLSTSPTLTTPIVTTTIGVGNATPSASGAGITFPATQSASTDANTLDDYEEGTWTPVLNRQTTSPTISYGIQEGKYTKIGREVIVHATIQVSSISAAGSGTNVITGLPFPANTTGARYGLNGVVHYNTTFTTVTRTLMCYAGGFTFTPALTTNTSELVENYLAGYLSFTAVYTTDT